MKPPFSRTLPDLLRERAEVDSDALAAVGGGRRVTYGELLERSEMVASVLAGRGIARGDRVGLIVSNRIEWLEIAFGAMMSGAVAVPFSTWSTRKELEFLIPDSKVKMLFSLSRFGDRNFAEDLGSMNLGEVKVCLLGSEATSKFERYEDLAGGVARDFRLAPGEGPSAFDDAFVLYTSGSTSAPKGVRLKQYGVVENGFNIGERQGLGATDRVFLSAPLFWSYGGANALPATFSHGGCLVLMEKFEAAHALDIIEQEKCTAIYTLPGMTNALLREPGFDKRRTASLRTGLTIGAAKDFLAAAKDLGISELCNVYGATETYGNCAVAWHHWSMERRAHCQGPLLPGQEIRVRDEKTGEILGAGRAGMVEIRGYVTPGYSGASAVLNGEAFTEDGYYRTGDVGMVDEDGAFVFIGRSVEMIKRAGINVSPAEIEDVLLTHDVIAAAAVVGVPDSERGEAIVAFVVPKKNAAITGDEIRTHCRAALSKYKIPDRVEIRTALPLTPTGKLARKELKQSAVEAMSDRTADGVR
ncbi:fatty-acyl-CoA synthase [Mesorhizobium sp. J18]|uniref:class I adenylate-forming enzyme family protein n=1 Tax=Mesorhizobium sp. J18 TaxID=935263 RepID=UPI00119C54E9|nr:class I adenylate-forming enzyme family protein [Mesorhizobium sp. J18]TWG92809.1 fatty-acyl-CoA synthase [Mesorhizobium sp. J18]